MAKANTNVTLTESEIEEASKYLKNHLYMRPFCHLPYTLSLANKESDKEDYVGKVLKIYENSCKIRVSRRCSSCRKE